MTDLMSRRRFFCSLLASAAAAGVLSKIPGLLEESASALPVFPAHCEYYFGIVHPDAFRSLVAMQAREQWKAEWRRQRLARRSVVEPEVEIVGELGTFEGFRFIEEDAA